MLNLILALQLSIDLYLILELIILLNNGVSSSQLSLSSLSFDTLSHLFISPHSLSSLFLNFFSHLSTFSLIIFFLHFLLSFPLFFPLSLSSLFIYSRCCQNVNIVMLFFFNFHFYKQKVIVTKHVFIFRF
ncbi:hypothetical protein PanWU01x14_183940 [Parasponia andersonii]|uniref:Transmembrane protein n=1 Tax=Parasponia andersonii TaxID=3476 RepID=A0A2P5C4U1_PARAD|nr:hypothetical protein PanWU01x14_183940 [Parasponia andersonii]